MITCSKCGLSKPDYNFFRYVNKYDKAFFTAGIPTTSNVCFECGGPYRCIVCGEVKHSLNFRIMGRVCDACKATPPTFTYTSKMGSIGTHSTDTLSSAANALESEI